MSSGVRADAEVAETFSEIKLGHKYKYVIYKMTDNYSKIVLDQAVVEANYDDFLKALPENDARYAIYDFDYVLPDGGKRNKLVFVAWVPDTAKIKAKMVYASSKDAIKKVLIGIQVEIQATEQSELEWNLIFDKASHGGLN